MKSIRKSFHHNLKVFISCSDYNCITSPLEKFITLKIFFQFNKQNFKNIFKQKGIIMICMI